MNKPLREALSLILTLGGIGVLIWQLGFWTVFGMLLLVIGLYL